MSVYAEEHTGLKDTITFEFTGSNLDKKDLFSESDPFFTLSRLNPDGSDTIVYRSDYLKDEPNPSWPEVTITSDKLCNGDWNRRLRVSCTLIIFPHHNFLQKFRQINFFTKYLYCMSN